MPVEFKWISVGSGQTKAATEWILNKEATDLYI